MAAYTWTVVRRWRGGVAGALAAALASVSLACGASTDARDLPPNVQDPSTVQTPSGALERYRGALRVLPRAFDWFAMKSAILTDEMAALPAPFGAAGRYSAIDSRQDLAEFESEYNDLHKVRAQAREARGFLAAYVSDSSAELQSHLYAVEAYAEIFLADLFCSGIPLSTVDFDGDYTLASGSTTTQVYTHAVTLFDSALALGGDSTSFLSLAAVGRGRALLALGRYADAAAAVAGVPDGFTYQVTFIPDSVPQRMLWLLASKFTTEPGTPSVGDREGFTGLDFLSSGDPRTPVTDLGPDVLQKELYFPAKYPATDSVTLTMADAVEARLIEAEAALQADPEGGQWLAKLNTLRTDGTYETQPSATHPGQTDTLWHAGAGGVAGLSPLADPGTEAARVDLLFRERAFWLYVTGHRQGDLRRLIRQYHRNPDDVYPRGTYSASGRLYGTAVVAPVPDRERELNPKYTGCFPLGV